MWSHSIVPKYRQTLPNNNLYEVTEMLCVWTRRVIWLCGSIFTRFERWAFLSFDAPYVDKLCSIRLFDPSPFCWRNNWKTIFFTKFAFIDLYWLFPTVTGPITFKTEYKPHLRIKKPHSKVIEASGGSIDFKNWGGGGEEGGGAKYRADQNNVRTFFFLFYSLQLLYYIIYTIKLRYCCYIFYKSPLIPSIFQNLLFTSLSPK